MRRKQFKSLYVHVPFCRKKCKYCDFFSGNFPRFKPHYRRALLRELSLRSPEFSQFPTIYFGGGTPSTMEPNFFEPILAKVGQFSEVTVEFNPEDAVEWKLRELSLIGVNRISLGVQSFSEERLKVLGRTQTPQENMKAVETVCSVFRNVSIDLIYGIPGQTVEEFLKDLKTAVSFPIKHISLYALTVYEETPLFREVASKRVELPPEETVFKMYSEAVSLLESHGFKRYEISNFAVPGFESKHNLTYWRLKNYLGIGASAASFQTNKYWKNIANLERYVESLEREELPVEEEETYTEEEVLKLKLIMGLRLTEGVNLKDLKLAERFEEAVEKSERVKSILEEGLAEYTNGQLKLKGRGFFVSNPVISELVESLF